MDIMLGQIKLKTYDNKIFIPAKQFESKLGLPQFANNKVKIKESTFAFDFHLDLFGFCLNSNRIQIVLSHIIIETEGAADPGEGQDPQDLEQGKSSLFFDHVDPNCEINFCLKIRLYAMMNILFVIMPCLDYCLSLIPL